MTDPPDGDSEVNDRARKAADEARRTIRRIENWYGDITANYQGGNRYSAMAWDSTSRDGREGRCERVFAWFLARDADNPPGATGEMAVNALRWGNHKVTPRITQLRAANLLVVTGEGRTTGGLPCKWLRVAPRFREDMP